MADDTKHASFFTTLPGILTASAGLVAAITALIAGLHQAGLIGQHASADKPPAADATSEPALEPAKPAVPPSAPIAQAASVMGIAARPSEPTPQPAAAPAPQPAAPAAPQPAAPATAIKAAPKPTARSGAQPPAHSTQAVVEEKPSGPEAATVPANAFLALVLDGDSRVYFITRDNQILGGPPGAAPTRVGTRIHKSGEYPWMLVVDGKQYVTNGHLGVFSLSADGTPAQVGHTQKL